MLRWAWASAAALECSEVVGTRAATVSWAADLEGSSALICWAADLVGFSALWELARNCVCVLVY